MQFGIRANALPLVTISGSEVPTELPADAARGSPVFLPMRSTKVEGLEGAK